MSTPPWRTVAPRPRRPDVAVRSGPPLAEIAIYEDLITLTRRTGRTWRSHPISADALAQTLAQLPQSSGLLPPHTLAVGRVGGLPFAVVLIPARKRTLRTEQRTYDLILPPLVWGGCGQDYRLFALAQDAYPARDIPLWRAPFPNVYENGGICWGDTAARPDAAPATLAPAFDLFCESLFNNHLAGHKSVSQPVSVLAQWAALAKMAADAYPFNDLLPAERSLAWLIGGGPWS